MKLRSSLIGALIIVVQAAALGLVANTVRTDKLPMVRKPLSTTRKVASKADLFPAKPVVKPAVPKKAEKQESPNPVPIPQAAEKPGATAATPGKIPGMPVTPGFVIPEPQKPIGVQQIPTPAQTAMSKPAKPTPKPTAPKRTTVTAKKPKKVEALFTTLPDAKSLYDANAAVFLDARPKVDFDAEHIRGARSLPEDLASSSYTSVLGQTSKDATIVTYCSDPECRGAMKLADALVAKGYARVFILLEGLPGWKDAGYPTEGALSR